MAAVQRVEQRCTEDAWPPEVDERVAVGSHPGLVPDLVGGSCRRFVMPERSPAVVHEPATGRSQLETQVDILGAVVIFRGEAADLPKRIQPDEQAGRRQRRPVLDLGGRRPQRVGAGADDPGEWDRLAAIEADPGMLERQVGEVRSGPGTAAMPWVDQARPDRHRLPGRHRLHHVPQPVRVDRVDVVVEEADELAGGDRHALAVRVGERSVVAIANDPHGEWHVETHRQLRRAVRRSVVDDDDLDIPVRGRGDGPETALEVLAAVAIEDDDRNERSAVRDRQARIRRQGRDQGAFGLGRGAQAPLMETASEGPHGASRQAGDTPYQTSPVVAGSTSPTGPA